MTNKESHFVTLIPVAEDVVVLRLPQTCHLINSKYALDDIYQKGCPTHLLFTVKASWIYARNAGT